ncbi:MAG: hypothetical protein AB7O67_23680 [Vicinamibacterales bacterium]
MTTPIDTLTAEELGIEPEGIEPDGIEPEPEPQPEAEPDTADGIEPEPEEPTTTEAPAQERALERSSHDLVAQATALTITNPESFQRAGQLLEDLKGFHRQIEEFWEEPVAKAHAAWKALTTRRADMVNPLKEAVAVLSSRYATFAREERAKAEKLRREEEERLRKAEQDRLAAEAKATEERAAALRAAAEAAPSRAEAAALETEANQAAADAEVLAVEAQTVQAPVLPPAAALPAPKSTSVRENWTFEVTDPLALIKAVAAGTVGVQAVIPNETYLRARAKADKGTVQIPGVRFYDKGSVAVRRAR